MAPITLESGHLRDVAALGIPVPAYERDELQPRIVHIGVGGFHRAHLAAYVHELAAAGGDWGIVGLGLLDQDARIAEALRAQDHLYTLVEKGAGEPTAQVIGSLCGFVHAPPGADDAATELVAARSTAILSLTVTEAGYAEPEAGEATTFDRVAAGLLRRRDNGAGSMTILSCDNLPGNGDAARVATLNAAARVSDELRAWVAEHCTFPNAMVDRITPVTADADREWLRSRGVEDRWPVVAEPFRQWVVEDDFAAGRPPFEDVGALFTNRVEDWERYKLRFLNAGHSGLAYLCALTGIEFVHEAMADPDVHAFVTGLLCEEALPTVTEIPGHSREDYIATVLERFANPGVGDTIARLCIDGTAKFPTFLIPTVAAQLERSGPVDRAATALAGWARYLGTVTETEQALDAHGERSRACARAALADPLAFLELDTVFPPVLRESERFRDAFVAGYRAVAEEGAAAAMRRAARAPADQP